VKAREKIDRYSKSLLQVKKQKNHCHSPEMRQDQKNKKTRGTQKTVNRRYHTSEYGYYCIIPGKFEHTELVMQGKTADRNVLVQYAYAVKKALNERCDK